MTDRIEVRFQEQVQELVVESYGGRELWLEFIAGFRAINHLVTYIESLLPETAGQLGQFRWLL